MLFALFPKNKWEQVSQVSLCTAAAISHATVFQSFTGTLQSGELPVNNSGKHYAVLLACSNHEDISVSVEALFMNGKNHLSSDVCGFLSQLLQDTIPTHFCAF